MRKTNTITDQEIEAALDAVSRRVRMKRLQKDLKELMPKLQEIQDEFSLWSPSTGMSENDCGKVRLWLLYAFGAGCEVNMEWQPIETAPKDGREILCMTEELDQVVLCWDDFWVSGFDGPDVTPTHWMPLPAPPKPVEPVR